MLANPGQTSFQLKRNGLSKAIIWGFIFLSLLASSARLMLCIHEWDIAF